MTNPNAADDNAVATDENTVSPGLFSSAVVTIPRYRIGWLARIMYGNVFEGIVIAVIIANAASLAALTFADLDPRVAAAAIAIDRFAIIFYTVEVALRIVSYGTRPWMFFRNGWNIFDFLVVVAIPFLNGGTVIFRLVRLLRILRIFRFLPEVRILMISMIKSVAPLANLALLIGFLMFIYAMAGVYLFGDANPERWGDVGQAMITLTIMLTLENFPDTFLGGLEVTPFALLYFLSYMFFIVFTVLNVLIGIVLTAMDQAREEVGAERAAAGLPPLGLSSKAVPPGSGAEQAGSPSAEIDALDGELDAAEKMGPASPDHVRRIREEIERLRQRVESPQP